MRAFLLFAASSPLVNEPSTMDSSGLVKVLAAVGVLVFALMGYLGVDWIRSRAASRKLEARRQMAKQQWQEELKAMNARKK